MSVRTTWPYAVFGAILSSYALYVEHKVSHKLPDEEEFSALCDIEQIGASCSSVFQLPEGRMISYFGLVPNGHMLDVPNAALGLVFYTVWLFVLPKLPNTKLVTFVVASLAMSSSVFLAIQLMILKELCILCWSTHAINARLWWNAYSTNFHGSSSASSSSEPNRKGGKAKIKQV